MKRALFGAPFFVAFNCAAESGFHRRRGTARFVFRCLEPTASCGLPDFQLSVESGFYRRQWTARFVFGCLEPTASCGLPDFQLCCGVWISPQAVDCPICVSMFRTHSKLWATRFFVAIFCAAESGFYRRRWTARFVFRCLEPTASCGLPGENPQQAVGYRVVQVPGCSEGLGLAQVAHPLGGFLLSREVLSW